jgi:hypothetical protein
MDEILSFNNPGCIADLSIYTILTLEKLIEYYKHYRTEFFREIHQNDQSFTAIANNDNKYGLPEYFISNDFKINNHYDFGFHPLSLIQTDNLFENKTINEDELDFMTLMNDKYFLHIKNLRKTLNEDGIPHYVVVQLVRKTDHKPTEFFIGGLNKNLEPVFNRDNFELYFKHLFTKDEWFFKPEKRYGF